MKNISTLMLEKYNRQLAKAAGPAEREIIKKRIYDFLQRHGNRNKRKQLSR